MMPWKPAVLMLLVLCPCGCLGPVPAPAPVPRPAAGYWFDAFQTRRAALANPEFLAGAAKIKITPSKPGVRIAGHGHYRKRSQGVLDDLYARVLYLDAGAEAVVLVSLDFIGWMYPRVERIRARVSKAYGHRILVTSTHNHAGPDTEGIFGPALLGLLPVRSGIDPQYLDWVERRVAKAIMQAVARARPARLFLGQFEAPQGLARNLRDPEDLPRQVTVLRAAGSDGFTIGTVVNYANHAEALQDKNRLLSAEFPGVLCRQVDLALGGVTLFVSGPAGGMIEPANDPDDSRAKRIAFCRHLGGTLAEGVISQAIGGMEEIAKPSLRLYHQRLELPFDKQGLVAQALNFHLLEPRPFIQGRLITELALVDFGPLQLLTIPGEPTPAAGRLFAAQMKGPYRIIATLGLDHLAYILTDQQFEDPRFEYERWANLGRQTFQLIFTVVESLTDQARSKQTRD